MSSIDFFSNRIKDNMYSFNDGHDQLVLIQNVLYLTLSSGQEPLLAFPLKIVGGDKLYINKDGVTYPLKNEHLQKVISDSMEIQVVGTDIPDDPETLQIMAPHAELPILSQTAGTEDGDFIDSFFDEAEDIELGDIVSAREVMYDAKDPSDITELFKHRFDNQISITKVKAILLSLIKNHNIFKGKSIGEMQILKGLPSWIVPIACSKLLPAPTDQMKMGIVHEPKPSVGKSIAIDITPGEKTMGMDAIVSRTVTFQGMEFEVDNAELSRVDHGYNMIHVLERGDSCPDVDSLSAADLDIKREPTREYKHEIILKPQFAEKVASKHKPEPDDIKQRVKCGRAFAQAVAESYSVAKISIKRVGDGEQKHVNVVGLLIQNPDNTNSSTSGRDQITRLDKELPAKIDDIISKYLSDRLSDSFIDKLHNIKPIIALLEKSNLKLSDISPERYRQIVERISSSHPEIKYSLGSWAKTNKNKMLEGFSRSDLKDGFTYDEVDYGIFKDDEQKYKYFASFEDGAPLPPVPEYMDLPEGNDLVRPDAIQLASNDDVLYKFGDKLYTRDDYNKIVVAKGNNLLREMIEAFPSSNEPKSAYNKAVFARKNLEDQILRKKSLLSGLSIKLTHDLPPLSEVVTYLSALLESGNEEIYKETLDNFVKENLVRYDEDIGRYSCNFTDNMIICICYKTYLDKGSISPDDPFVVGNKCKHCSATLLVEEQVTDYNALTDRDTFAIGGEEERVDDRFLTIEKLLDIIINNLAVLFKEHQWFISDKEKKQLFAQLKDSATTSTEHLELHPFGRGVASGKSSFDNDLRGYLQRYYSDGAVNGNDCFLIKNKKKKPKGQTVEKESWEYGSSAAMAAVGMEVPLRNIVTQYLKKNLTDTAVKEFCEEEGSIKDCFLPKKKKGATEEEKRKTNEFVDMLNRVTNSNFIDNETLLMLYFTLPILPKIAKNITMIISHIASFIEIKYGEKVEKNSTFIYQSKGKEISDVLKSKINSEFIHTVANKYQSEMYHIYSTEAVMLSQGTGQHDVIAKLLIPMKRIFNGKYQGFSSLFTDYYEKLIRETKGIPFNDQNTRNYTKELNDIRQQFQEEYSEKRVGKTPIVRDSQFSMYYNPKSVLPQINRNTSTIQEYLECKQVQVQQTYNEYTKTLREGYVVASDTLAKGIVNDIDYLTTVGAAAQGVTTMSWWTEGGDTRLQDVRKSLDEEALPRLKDINAVLNTSEESELLVSIPDQQDNICQFITSYQDVSLNEQKVSQPIFHTYNGDHGSIEHLKYIHNRDVPGDLPSNLQKLATNLIEYDENDELDTNIFTSLAENLLQADMTQESKNVITKTFNEHRKKAREQRSLTKFMDQEFNEIPDFMKEDSTPIQLTPWGRWAENNYGNNLNHRKIKKIQNLAKSITKIIRWMGNNDTTQSEGYIDVFGASIEFKTEKDHLDPKGYILSELSAIKADIVDDSLKLHEYEMHFPEIYNLSFKEFKELLDSAPTQQQFMQCIVLSIKLDILKHKDYISSAGRSNEEIIEGETWSEYNSGHTQDEFKNLVEKILVVLNNYINSEITDPDRTQIDKLYDDKFREYAAKRKIVATGDKKQKSKLDINSMYPPSADTLIINMGEDSEYVDQAQAGDVVGGEEPPRDDPSTTIADLAQGIGLVDKSDDPDLFDPDQEGDGNFENH
jgi:hypothetical protein